MNKENTLKLFNDFPILYAGRKKPLIENLMSFGFECGDGWFNLIYELSKKLSEVDPECEAVQVKEKFGGLRFYTNGVNQFGDGIITEYENKSYKTCEDCGDTETAELRGDNWVVTLCNKCYKEQEERKNKNE